MMGAEKPSSKGQAWFCTTGLPSDIVVEVDDMSFHLHKFPLMSKSQKLFRMITEQETNASATRRQKRQEEQTSEDQEHEIEEEEEEEEENCQIPLPDFPGGSETFEMAAKFCYGVKMDLSASTVAPLRCAAEFLEMTEEYSEDNLISKTERYISHSVLKSLKDSAKALKSCESVSPLAEDLGIVQRCIDSIASRASAADPALFGWPVNDADHLARGASNEVLWNGIDQNMRRRQPPRSERTADSWFEDLALLSLATFKRLILAMRARDLSSEIIEKCLMQYAKKYFPGTSRSNRKPPSSSAASQTEQREHLESIIANLPLEKSSRSPTSTRFLFGLLRTANILNASESCKAALEKKIGTQLEQATLDDLLIPSYSYLNETLYDVDCVGRILSHFLDGLEESNESRLIEAAETLESWSRSRSPALMLVGKLIDGYLSEIASDGNLKPDKFYNLVVSLPDQARLYDDGLYRAVDVYLKAHPWISETEREKISGVLDCQKLTLEACTHAAQNERLPLRAVVQVLFFEQLQLRHAIAGTLVATDQERLSATRAEEEEEEEEEEQAASGGWRATVRENQVLRLDMDGMRTRVHQLERECSTMKKVIEKIENHGGGAARGGWRGRLGCKFKTQVCDSHEASVRKGRHRSQ